MVTEFGKVLRKIRIDHGEILKQMADRLNVSSSFLSSVENGKKAIPADWCEKIAVFYQLDEIQTQLLKDSASASARTIRVDLSESSAIKMRAAFVFAREFSEMSDEQAESIIAFMNKKSK